MKITQTEIENNLQEIIGYSFNGVPACWNLKQLNQALRCVRTLSKLLAIAHNTYIDQSLDEQIKCDELQEASIFSKA